MSKDLIEKLFGKDLMNEMYDIVHGFLVMNSDVDYIYKVLRRFNESFRTGIYLIALESNNDRLATKVKRANRLINIDRVDAFLKAYDTGKVDEFLKKTSKVDKIALLSDLDLDVSLEERIKLPKKKRDYYRILSNSILLDKDGYDKDGIDTFINHKKEN